WPAIVDAVVDHNLAFSLLDFHHLAEFVGLADLALADDFGRRLEQAEDLALGARITTEDPRAGLFHNLLDTRYHRIDFLTQAFERQLLQDVCRPLDAVSNLL